MFLCLYFTYPWLCFRLSLCRTLDFILFCFHLSSASVNACVVVKTRLIVRAQLTLKTDQLDKADKFSRHFQVDSALDEVYCTSVKSFYRQISCKNGNIMTNCDRFAFNIISRKLSLSYLRKCMYRLKKIL